MTATERTAEIAAAAAPTRNLLILHSPNHQALSDWEEVQAIIQAEAPDIDVRIATNGQPNSVTRRWQATRPSLLFSPLHVIVYEPPGGKIYDGRQPGKLREMRRLAELGLPVPRWTELRADIVLPPGEWGEFVIAKPVAGMRGDGVTLIRASEAAARYPALSQNGSRRTIVQDYVDNLDAKGRQIEFRVVTVFGEPVHSIYRRSLHPRKPLAEIADGDGRITIGRATGQERELIKDDEVLDFARRVGALLPHVPVLGLDILRSQADGQFRLLETNPSGHVWHFSSKWTLERTDPKVREGFYRQFDVLRRTAELLIAKTRAEAI